MPVVTSSGTLSCLGSAAAFGAAAVLGKLAYAEGACRRACSPRSSAPERR